ncbi:MAG: GNAT family N-acetyltransferase [Janthinobacterium lividum]
MIGLTRLTPNDVPELLDFLARVDLTLSGLDDPDVRLWLARDGSGDIYASTGYELSADGRHALIRSVAVEKHRQGRGTGRQLAHWALQQASDEGAERAWLFSHRSGPFWQQLGFATADRDELAAVLTATHQVELFRGSGQLHREVAWSRVLGAHAPDGAPASGVPAGVRTFVWGDYPATARLWLSTGRDVMPEDELRATLEHGPDLMLVAAHPRDGIVGAVLGTFDGRRGWIHRLAVHPDHRRTGLASALVREVEQRLSAHGAPRINLLVMPDNTGALQFWRRLGYLTCPDVLCTKPIAILPGLMTSR